MFDTKKNWIIYKCVVLYACNPFQKFMKKSIKYLFIVGIAVDVAITVFLFVISIIMLVLVGKYTVQHATEHASGLILYLLNNTSVYFWGFVFPLFVLLAGNIVGLVFYVKKTSAKENAPTKLDDLSDEQKEALRQELLKDLLKDSENSAKNNKEE